MGIKIAIEKDKIATFCDKWKIRELAFFGSVLRDDFRDDSDVDVLVRFEKEAEFGLLDIIRAENELQEILGRKVDLSEREAVERDENYIRRRHILEGLRVIHEK